MNWYGFLMMGPVRLRLMSEIDSSSKPCFEEEIIKCVVLEYVIYSPALQMVAAFKAPIPAETAKEIIRCVQMFQSFQFFK